MLFLALGCPNDDTHTLSNKPGLEVEESLLFAQNQSKRYGPAFVAGFIAGGVERKLLHLPWPFPGEKEAL